MRQRALFLVLILAAIVFSCGPAFARSNIDLVVYNDTDQTLDVTVQSSSAGTVNLQRMAPKATPQHYSLPVKNADNVSVVATLPDSATVDTQTVSTQPQTTTLPIHLAIGPDKLVAADAMKDLTNQFLQIGPPSGLAALDGPTAISTLLGAIILVDAAHPEATPYILQPSILGTAVDPNNVQYGPYSHADTIVVSTTMGVAGNVNVPAIVQFGVTFQNNSVYKVSYSLIQAGKMSAVLPKSFGQALATIPAADKPALCATAGTFHTPTLEFINTLYGIKGGSFSQQQGQEIQRGATLGGNAFVSGNMAYDFSNSQTTVDNILPSVINYMGPAVPSSVLCTPDQVVALQSQASGDEARGVGNVAHTSGARAAVDVGGGSTGGEASVRVVRIGLQQRLAKARLTTVHINPGTIKALYQRAGQQMKP